MRGSSCSLAVLGFVLVVASSPSAWAAAWSPPVDTPVVVVPYGASRPAGVHRGVDVQAASASEVRSPVAGYVVFAGTVPADGGGTCVAVTVETTDGLRISMLPLDGAYVRSGASVAGGEAIGRLAATGDDSCDEAHLHIGLRQGGQYVDPAPFLPAAVSVSEPPSPMDETPSMCGSPEVGPPPADVSAGVAQPAALRGSEGAPVDRSVGVAFPGTAAVGSAALSDTACTLSRADSGVALHVSGEADAMVRSARLIPDSGVLLAKSDRSAERGGDGAADGSTWTSRRSTLGPTAHATGANAIRSLAVAAAVVAVVVGASRAKAFVRVR